MGAVKKQDSDDANIGSSARPSIEDTIKLLSQTGLEPFKWKEDLNYNTIAIPDKRDIDAVTGIPLMDTNRLHSNIDKGLATHIIQKAIEHGVDPYDALAVAQQETSFHEEYSDNPFHVIIPNPNELEKFEKDPVDYSMQIMKDKNDLAKRLGKKTDADRIQAWNGYGKIGGNTEGSQKKMYGIDVSKEPIDMAKNPVYGKRVVDIRDNILKKNPDIVKLVEGLRNGSEKPVK